MATEPGVVVPFMPGEVLLDGDGVRHLAGVPERCGARAIDRADVLALFSFTSMADYVGHNTAESAHLVVGNFSLFHGINFTADIVDENWYAWRANYTCQGPANTHRGTPGAAGFKVLTNDDVGAKYLASAINKLGSWLPCTGLAASATKSEVSVLNWFRRHPNPIKNQAIAEAARETAKAAFPDFVAFVRGFRGAKVVRAHKVLLP